MVLFKIDAPSVALLKLECNAPRPVDVDRVADRSESLQRVKVEAWKVHVLGLKGYIQPVEANKDSPLHF